MKLPYWVSVAIVFPVFLIVECVFNLRWMLVFNINNLASLAMGSTNISVSPYSSLVRADVDESADLARAAVVEHNGIGQTGSNIVDRNSNRFSIPKISKIIQNPQNRLKITKIDFKIPKIKSPKSPNPQNRFENLQNRFENSQKSIWKSPKSTKIDLKIPKIPKNIFSIFPKFLLNFPKY